ncbi:MAG TPA: hypothetical protein VI913_04610 [Candidatus Peribacteraceae bacterium]|nr:MAG: hypothetical protein A3J67_03610 [Parcubacteria group bacterium RIFCSPHIGHO2_02_FULL_48_10b]HLD64145.1 hypothetical protein [Candidatus Peribacteraceae bacterium]
MRWFVITSVTLNIVLSNLCMMPMAYAHLAPQPVAGAIEMAMTPSMPMTPADCEGCARMSARLSESVFPAGPVHCDSGHCFEQTAPLVDSSVVSGASLSAINQASDTENIELAANDDRSQLATHAPPIAFTFTSTEVLRL